MRKILSILAFAILLQIPAQAQFTRFGAKLGFGPSYVSDELLTKSPILGANLGGYVDYMFSEMKNPWADNIYLEFGLNIVRRGSNVEQVFPDMLSVRQSYYHNYFAQIPVLFGFKYEIPQLPADNYASFYLGPAVSVGLFGRYWDRHVSPGYPQTNWNYDTYVTEGRDARRSFKHMRRVDVSVILGVAYQWHNFTFDLHLDHGFVPLFLRDDVLVNLQQQQNGKADNGQTEQVKDRNAYLGTNQAIIFSIGYQLPFAE